MEDKTYQITLADGTVIDGLRMNGNNFIAAKELDSAIFEGNCSPVNISDGEHDEVHENAEMFPSAPTGDGFWFIIQDVAMEELKRRQLRADIEYLAMMAGIEL